MDLINNLAHLLHVSPEIILCATMLLPAAFSGYLRHFVRTKQPTNGNVILAIAIASSGLFGLATTLEGIWQTANGIGHILMLVPLMLMAGTYVKQSLLYDEQDQAEKWLNSEEICSEPRAILKYYWPKRWKKIRRILRGTEYADYLPEILGIKALLELIIERMEALKEQLHSQPYRPADLDKSDHRQRSTLQRGRATDELSALEALSGDIYDLLNHLSTRARTATLYEGDGDLGEEL